jgi:hypothetical protein
MKQAVDVSEMIKKLEALIDKQKKEHKKCSYD